MRNKHELIDDDGNVMPVPGPDASDVAKAIYLLEYARLRGFRLGPTLKVGELVTQVQDLRQLGELTKDETSKMPDLVPGTDMHTLLGNSGQGDE